VENGSIPKLLQYSYIDGNMEYIDRVDVGSDTCLRAGTHRQANTALQKNPKQPGAII